MSDMLNDERLNNNTDKKLYVLCLPVFAEYNVEIFNGKRAFIDRLSWLENTIKICQILRGVLCNRQGSSKFRFLSGKVLGK